MHPYGVTPQFKGHTNKKMVCLKLICDVQPKMVVENMFESQRNSFSIYNFSGTLKYGAVSYGLLEKTLSDKHST